MGRIHRKEGCKVLIESDWNLKNVSRQLSLQYQFVLIESDWNLKYHHSGSQLIPVRVLIESDWNLKITDLNIFAC